MTQFYSDTVGIPRTDPKRWRLRTTELGREAWEYIEQDKVDADPQSTFVQWLLQDEEFPTPSPRKEGDDLSSEQACYYGASFYKLLQDQSQVFSHANIRGLCS